MATCGFNTLLSVIVFVFEIIFHTKKIKKTAALGKKWDFEAVNYSTYYNT